MKTRSPLLCSSSLPAKQPGASRPLWLLAAAYSGGQPLVRLSLATAIRGRLVIYHRLYTGCSLLGLSS
jgi:hypothetical protein